VPDPPAGLDQICPADGTAAVRAALSPAYRAAYDSLVELVDAALAAYAHLMEAAMTAQASDRQPAALHLLPGTVKLIVAAGPGESYEAWRHVAVGVWIARDGEETGDVTAETMTAGELRALLAAR
jgi:hypothetical protein